MEAANFPESNLVLSKPESYTHDECDALCVWRGHDSADFPIVVSCWRPTQAELDEINKTGKVWLVVHGVTMPPAYLNGHNPFTPLSSGNPTA